jgi:hypothetical protein
MSDTRDYVDTQVSLVGDWEKRISDCEAANETEE